MLLGFFCVLACLLPAGQVKIGSTPNLWGNVAVMQYGQEIGQYVDETTPNRLGVINQNLVDHPDLKVFAGMWYGTPFPVPFDVIPVVEYYPVDDVHSQVKPVPAEPAYILQAFSWGDNLQDGIMRGRCSAQDTPASCATKYTAPSLGQERAMWCGAKAHHPLAIFWYYATPSNLSRLLWIEHATCRRRPQKHGISREFDRVFGLRAHRVS